MPIKTFKKQAKGCSPQTQSGNPVAITDTFTEKVYEAMCAYQNDMGLSKPQDVVRIGVATLLKREGYLN